MPSLLSNFWPHLNLYNCFVVKKKGGFGHSTKMQTLLKLSEQILVIVNLVACVRVTLKL